MPRTREIQDTNIRIIIREPLLYLTFFFVIFGWYGMWFLLSNPIITITVAQHSSYVLIMIAAVISVRIKKKDIECAIIIVCYLLVYLVATHFYNSVSFVFGFVLVCFFGYFLCSVYINRNSIKSMAIIYCNIVYFFAIMSLFFWLFGSILDILPGRIPLTYNWANNTYNTYTYCFLYFENPVQSASIMGHHFIRNTGVFAEAPGYASVLTMALGIELFWPMLRGKNNSKRHRYVLFLTLISTLSTKAFIVIGIVLLISFIGYIREKGKHSRSVIIIGFGVLVLLLIAVLFVIRLILIDKTATQSYGIRVDDFITCLKTWKSHPLFGVGYSNVEAVLINSALMFRTVQSVSMGVFVVLAEGGIYLLFFYILPAVLMLRVLPKANTFNYIFFISMVFTDALISHVMFTPRILLLTILGYCCWFNRSKLIANNLEKNGNERT